MQTFSNYKFLIEPIHLAINIDIIDKNSRKSSS